MYGNGRHYHFFCRHCYLIKTLRSKQNELNNAVSCHIWLVDNGTYLSEKYPMKRDPTMPPAKKEASPVPTKYSRSQTRSKEATRL